MQESIDLSLLKKNIYKHVRNEFQLKFIDYYPQKKKLSNVVNMDRKKGDRNPITQIVDLRFIFIFFVVFYFFCFVF